ncbi:polysaccharide biosynthesis tyrosine autokinase [Arthrobacter sp. M2012083]|uniref:polysaccharide biosynthesis tyrosine autokinase n=1 Tax=Arthrobacter sp. M2012083 TaxID=1197706 RepID=UPI0003633DAB|nr:polysaccharide biosynthesis tyrosine autokinase [Arthrobacter sp. M2012083]
MEIRDYLSVLRRNWILITALTLLGLLCAGIATVLIKPTYTSETQLFVAIQNSGSVQELQQGNTFSQARVQSYVKTATTPVVLQPAIDSLGLDETPVQLASRIKATTDLNTVLINISVTDQSPVQSAAIAQAVGDSLIRTVENLEKPSTDGVSPIRLSIVTPAVAPAQPSAPNVRVNLAVGLLLGLAVGLGTALLRSTLDSRIRGEADLRRVTTAPVLGGISFDPQAAKTPLLTQSATQSHRSESFRQLRTNLQFANVGGKTKTILVTSSVPGEGKSTTATNLAISLAQAGRTICIIDADLRRPMINTYLGLDRNAGLTTALVAEADVADLLQPWGDDNLYVLTSGQIPPNPSELLGSEEMQQLLLRLGQSFDTIIIDAPPLLPVTDAAVLSQYVDGVVMVVGAQKLTHHVLQKSLQSLEMVGARLLGVVLNRLPTKGPDAYAYSYTTYDATEIRESNRTARNNRRKASEAAPDAQVSAGRRLLVGGDPEDADIYARTSRRPE